MFAYKVCKNADPLTSVQLVRWSRYRHGCEYHGSIPSPSWSSAPLSDSSQTVCWCILWWSGSCFPCWSGPHNQLYWLQSVGASRCSPSSLHVIKNSSISIDHYSVYYDDLPYVCWFSVTSGSLCTTGASIKGRGIIYTIHTTHHHIAHGNMYR